jgi:hypothetical protein
LSSSSISAALEELSRLPASDRALLSGQCPGLAEYLAWVPGRIRGIVPPDEATIRRVLEAVDADRLDAAVGSWLDARLHAAGQAAGHGRRRRRAVAVDGKAVRGTRHAGADGQPVHLLAALDQRCGVVLGQVRVGGRTNEITRFAPLLEPLDPAGCVITADALSKGTSPACTPR